MRERRERDHEEMIIVNMMMWQAELAVVTSLAHLNIKYSRLSLEKTGENSG